MTSATVRPYSFAPSLLLASVDAEGLEIEAEAAGFQIGWTGRPEDLWSARSSLTPQAIVVALRGEPDEPLLDQLADLVDQGDPMVVQFPGVALRVVADRLGGTEAVLQVDPAPGELAGSLALMRLQPRQRLHDSSVATDTLRLQMLADQVGRIARTLAEMTDGDTSLGRRGGLRSPTDDFSPTPRPIATDAPVTAKAVRAVIAERRLRDEFLDPDLFGEPAWDMLLDLYAARLEHVQVSVSSLCIAAAVPSTTALRWLQTLTASGLVNRRADPRDKRRVFVELGPEAAEGMNGYFGALAG